MFINSSNLFFSKSRKYIFVFMFEEVSYSVSLQLSCKMKREFRAVEVCQMMSTSRAVQLAVKYATRIGLMQVAQRVNEIARQKADEERTDGVDAPSVSNSCSRLPLRWMPSAISRSVFEELVKKVLFYIWFCWLYSSLMRSTDLLWF